MANSSISLNSAWAGVILSAIFIVFISSFTSSPESTNYFVNYSICIAIILFTIYNYNHHKETFTILAPIILIVYFIFSLIMQNFSIILDVNNSFTNLLTKTTIIVLTLLSSVIPNQLAATASNILAIMLIIGFMIQIGASSFIFQS